MKKVSIIIPAYNEQNRIEKTIITYVNYFRENPHCSVDFIVVLNGCTDNTERVVMKLKEAYLEVSMIKIAQSGKGLAIKKGFEEALKKSGELIGFVDADMATQPEYFNDLINNIGKNDGIIASRYMKGSYVYPSRPFIKKWGRFIFYQSLVYLLFGLRYKDLQCGAKLFKKKVIQKITPMLNINQWAFDVEILYLCKKYNFVIQELPTVWYDQLESKLQTFSSGVKMLQSLFKLWWQSKDTKLL